jgi:hypothetical protein
MGGDSLYYNRNMDVHNEWNVAELLSMDCSKFFGAFRGSESLTVALDDVCLEVLAEWKY